MRSVTRVLTVLLLAVVVAGCGGDPEEKDPAMTPDEARAELTRVAKAVLDVIAPDQQVDVKNDGPATPCGGLGGNEYTKIKYETSVNAPAASPDAAADFTAITAQLRALGYDVDPTETMGDATTMVFRGDAVKGGILQHGDGPLSLEAETTCLDNPDKDNPFPDVQPSS
jgi:hypothetical protein